MRAVIATAATAFLLALGPASVAAADVSQQGPWQRAAPEYESSEPSDGAMLHEPPSEVRMTFSEPLDPSSSLMVHDECGRQIDDGDVSVMGADMTVGIAKTPAGTYTVMYSAVGFGGITGTSEGDFSFMVHAGPACDGSGDDENQGGGHSGHGGSSDGGHEGHSGQQDPEHSAHTDHPTGSSDQSTHESSHTEHSSGSMHPGKHGGHDAAGHHGGGHSEHNGSKHHNRPDGTTEPPPVAAPNVPAPPAPNSQAVLAALLMSLGFGVLGGWYLRTSGQR